MHNRLRAIRLCLLTALLAGCRPAPAAAVELNPAVRLPDRAVVVFFVDGMDLRRMEAMIDTGGLPHINRLFVRGGVGVEFAVTSLPAITYANAVSLITGLFPGHHGVMGNDWFDPHSLYYRDYRAADTYRTVNDHFTAPTIYEILDDRFTVSVQNHTRRGASVTIDSPVTSAIDWFFGTWSAVDQRVGRCMGRIAGIANKRGEWPALITFYFPGVDQTGHRRGAESRAYRDSLSAVDDAVGRITQALADAKLEDRTYFILLTDHGHIQNAQPKSVDVVRWLQQHRGLRTWMQPIADASRDAREAVLRDVDVVVVDGAFRRIALHLPGPDGWGTDPGLDVVRDFVEGQCRGEAAAHRIASRAECTPLCDLPGIDIVCARDGSNAARVWSREGCVRVERRLADGRKQYRLVAPTDAGASRVRPDPLHYLQVPRLAQFIHDGWHDSHEWLAATADHPYPDFVPQVVEMFDAPSAGDVVLFADYDWSFSPQDRSGHGSCNERDMRVPLYFRGPDLPAGTRIRHARLVDVMPTILDMLGESRRLTALEPLDGVSRFDELRGRVADR